MNRLLSFDQLAESLAFPELTVWTIADAAERSHTSNPLLGLHKNTQCVAVLKEKIPVR